MIHQPAVDPRAVDEGIVRLDTLYLLIVMAITFVLMLGGVAGTLTLVV